MTQAPPSRGLTAAPALPEGFLQDACIAVATARGLDEITAMLAGLHGLEPAAVDHLLVANAAQIDRLAQRAELTGEAVRCRSTALLSRLIRNAADALDAGELSQTQALGWATLLQKTSGLDREPKEQQGRFVFNINFRGETLTISKETDIIDVTPEAESPMNLVRGAVRGA